MAGVAALYLFFLIKKVSPLFIVTGNISKPVQVGRPMTLSCSANQVGLKLEIIIFEKVGILASLAFLLDPFYRRGRVYKRKFCGSVCLWVCLSVDLSVITFSFFEYSMI